MHEEVDHPEHYLEGNIETYDYIKAKLTPDELRGYIKGNLLRYVSRERYKGGTKDLRKIQWYLNRYLEDLERQVEKDKEKKEDQLERRIRELLYEDTTTQERGKSCTYAEEECHTCVGVNR